MAEQYAWSTTGHFQFARLDPAVIAAELQRINERDGGVATRVVVAEARAATSPLHAAFPWDDRHAAESYREIVARRLVRSIRVVQGDGGTVAQYVNVRVETEEGGPLRLYRPLVEVARDPSDLASALEFLTEKVVAAQSSLSEVRRAAADAGAVRVVERLDPLDRALSTARELASTLAAE